MRGQKDINPRGSIGSKIKEKIDAKLLITVK